MAMFGAGFGLHALYLQTMTGQAGLAWAGIESGQHVAQMLVLASLLHGAGIRANGRLGPLSPILRAVAMAAFSAFFLRLALAGTGSSAGFTYAAIAIGMAAGMVNAVADAVDAMRRAALKWTR